MNEEHDDERGTEPPAEGQPDHNPGEGEADPAPAESPGPMGNPANDEEALSQRQQEGD